MSRPKTPRVRRPSPLQQELTSTPTQPPPSDGFQDPAFWRRFSAAVHMSDEANLESGLRSAASTGDVKYDWLAQQHKERRRCRILCAVITLAVVSAILAIVLAVYFYFKARS